MDVGTILAIIGVIIFLGFLGEFIFRKTNIPDVIWLILIGILVGSVLRWVSPADLARGAPIFTTFALLFILFESALSINITQFIKEVPSGTILSIISFIFSVAIVALAMLAFGFEPLFALLTGMTLGGVSSAVVIPMVKNITIGKKTQLILIIESSLSDVLCIVGVISVMQIIVLQSFDTATVLNNIFGSFAIALFIGTIASLLWMLVLRKSRSIAASYMLTIAALLVVYGFTEYIKSNGAIACLAFGLVLGNSKTITQKLVKRGNDVLDSAAKSFYSELSFFVKTFSFVYLGILINFQFWLPFIIGLLLVIAIFLVRPLAIKLCIRKKVDLKDTIILESLIPKGLAAAILVQLPVQAGLPNSTFIANVVLSAVLFSIIISSILIFLIEQNYHASFGEIYRNLFKNF
ncbi:cation:proton antiporter [Nanoarchaeota archaeon]